MIRRHLRGALGLATGISLACGLLALLAGGAFADGSTAWDGARMSDPLDMARWVAGEGDRDVLARLRAEVPPAEQLPGVLGARWLEAPERALPALASLAGGRDPRVAPAAALAAHRIASSLDPRALEAREVDRVILEEARGALDVLARDETVRPDIARLAAFAAEQLRALSALE